MSGLMVVVLGGVVGLVVGGIALRVCSNLAFGRRQRRAAEPLARFAEESTAWMRRLDVRTRIRNEMMLELLRGELWFEHPYTGVKVMVPAPEIPPFCGKPVTPEFVMYAEPMPEPDPVPQMVRSA